MSVAVTGASGHVGANLVRTLIDQKRKVRVLHRNDTRGFEGLKVTKVQGDVLDKESLVKCFKGVETVFHCAAYITIDSKQKEQAYKINIQGPKNVAEACLECGVKRLVHFSSIHAYESHPENKLVDEKRALCDDDSHFCYDHSKAMGQKEILKAVEKGLDAVIVNPTAVMGPNDFKPSRMGAVLVDIYKGALPMLAKGGYNWVDVRDIVDGALAAEKNGKTGESYLLSGHWASFQEISHLISSITGKKTTNLMAPHWLAASMAPFSVMLARLTKQTPRLTPMSVKSVKMHRYISHSKATKDLGYNPRALDITIRDTLNWFHDQGVIQLQVN